MSETTVDELRRAAVADPRNAQLRHLLGAQYAAQQDFDSAVLEMSAAVALDPLLHLARFQLGLVHFVMQRAEQTLEVLMPLQDLDDDEALKHFSHGLVALLADDGDACIAHLRKGIELNPTNAALNNDMQQILDRLAAVLPTRATDTKASSADVSTAVEDSLRTDFSLYGIKN